MLELDLFKEVTREYIESISTQGIEPDPDAAMDYIEAEVKRRWLTRRWEGLDTIKVDISVNSTEYAIREPDPNDHWDAGRYGLNIHGVSLSLSDKYGHDVCGKPGDSAVVVVEHYSDGSTFGSTEYAEVKGIYPTKRDAEAAVSGMKPHSSYFGDHIAFLYFDVMIPTR